MNVGGASTFIIDAGAKGTDIVRIVAQLIAISQTTVLLQPRRSSPIDSVERISKLITAWPKWHSRPWIIAGHSTSDGSHSTYEGPFVQDCKGDDYGEQVSKLLEDYEWALFSYFTTFQDDTWTLVSRRPELHSTLLRACEPKIVLGEYNGEPSALREFKNASFYDYGSEGVIAYESAEQKRESPPLILCRIDVDNLDQYRLWDKEFEVQGEVIWFEEALSKLETVMELPLQGPYGHSLYRLCRASDGDAYRKLWSMASHDFGIAEATLSSDCNVSKLKELLEDNNRIDVIRQSEMICAWGYAQIYGGGADEHHAVFHARDAADTQHVWERVAADAISRF